jgi:two-component system OmpR family sensor kinase
LRTRLVAGILVVVAISVLVTVLTALVFTRRSLEGDALAALRRQVDLVAAQRRDRVAEAPALGSFLATQQVRLAVLTPAQAQLLLPEDAASVIDQRRVASGSLEIRGTPYLYAARRNGDEALVLLRSKESQQADWSPFLLGLAAAGLVGAALAAAVGVGLARAVARPVARVAEASEGLAGGREPPQLPESGPVEISSLAASFNELSRELKRAQDAERSFLLSVSHELKTPLTAIRGHAEALREGVLGGEQAGRVIEREARRLERLIRDLLDLARLRRHAFSVRSETVDLATLVDDVVARYGSQAADHGVELTALAEPGAAAVGDSDRLLQAVSNLVENALRCCRHGGAVRVVAAPGRLDVVDDGPGIAPEDVEHAFGRFYLWERYAGERRVGTGLGLAIVHELTQAMGGEATVRSTLGVGSTFSIVLPRPGGRTTAPSPTGTSPARRP